MRKPAPLPCLTSSLLVFAVSLAHAAAPAAAASAPATMAASPAPVPAAQAPAAQASTSSNASGGSSTAATSAAASGMPTIRNQSSAFVNNSGAIGPTTDAASFGPDSSFVNNPNPEVGLAPGQTSPGTAVGNEPSGLEGGSTFSPFGTNPNNPNTTAGAGTAAGAAGTAVPAEVVGAGGGFYGAGTAVGGTAVAISPGRPAASGTPLLDQATIEAQRREESRRASGEQPRIIGIAPRTNADRTDEMPDDPIIRY